MKHKINYDEKNNLLCQSIIGEYSTKNAEYFGDQYISHLDGKPYRQLIVDLREAGKMESRETRSIINETLNKAKITDVAYVGANATTRMIAKVLMKLGSLKAEANFLKDYEDAINWLKKRRKS